MTIYIAQRLVSISDNLGALVYEIFEIPVQRGPFVSPLQDRIPPAVQVKILGILKTMAGELAVLHLRFTRDGVLRFVESLENSTRAESLSAITSLRERFYDETLRIRFLYVEEKKLEFYNQARPFGEAVESRFPSAEYDIREAANCIALSRHTAAVMHCMRVLEVGLVALANSLKIKRSGKSWEADLNNFTASWQKQLAANPKLRGWKRTFFPQAFADFRHFKDAWRNHAMHAHARYGEQEAETVFEHVRTFMQHLATRLREKKRPKRKKPI